MAFRTSPRAGTPLATLFVAALLLVSISAPAQTVEQYPLAGKWGYYGIAAGADNNLWFSKAVFNALVVLKPDGTMTDVTAAGVTNPARVVRGPDNRIWFSADGVVGVVNYADHKVTTFPLDASCHMTSNFTTDRTALWFAEYCSDGSGTDRANLVKLTTAGTMTPYIVGTDAPHQVYSIVNGADDKIWLAYYFENSIASFDKTATTVTTFAVPTAGSMPYNLVVGPDANIWFFEVDADNIARIDRSGAIKEFAWSAPVPESVFLGPDNNFWTVDGAMQVRRTIVHEDMITSQSIGGKKHAIGISAIALAHDGNLWFTESTGPSLGIIRMDGIFVDDFEGDAVR